MVVFDSERFNIRELYFAVVYEFNFFDVYKKINILVYC